MLDDFALAERASGDDRPARRALVQRIHHELYGWVRAKVGWRNFEVGTELMRQTILRVLAGALSEQQQQQRAPCYRGSDEFVAAIRAVAEAELPRLLRAMHYRKEISKCPRRQLVYTQGLTSHSSRPAYHTRIEFDEQEKRGVLEALAKLPAGPREVAHLRYLEGCDFSELVRELDAAPIVVALRLYRATKLLVKAKHLPEPHWWWGKVREWPWRREQRRWWRGWWSEAARAHRDRARGRAGTTSPPPLVRVESGESVSLPVYRRELSLSEAHAHVSALTRALAYARRYGLCRDLDFNSLAKDLLRSLSDPHREPPRSSHRVLDRFGPA
jgi:DNA-directed RNA polymerase specialized sigma24 family protein